MATLQQAAEQLGVSVQTVRRWVKAGKLPAQLQAGPYGDAYDIPEAALDTAQMTTDVVMVDRRNDPAILGAIVAQAIAERDAAIMTALADIKVEMERIGEGVGMTWKTVEAGLTGRDQAIAELRGDVASLSDQIAKLTALLEKQQPAATARPWWRFWAGRRTLSQADDLRMAAEGYPL